MARSGTSTFTRAPLRTGIRLDAISLSQRRRTTTSRPRNRLHQRLRRLPENDGTILDFDDRLDFERNLFDRAGRADRAQHCQLVHPVLSESGDEPQPDSGFRSEHVPDNIVLRYQQDRLAPLRAPKRPEPDYVGRAGDRQRSRLDHRRPRNADSSCSKARIRSTFSRISFQYNSSRPRSSKPKMRSPITRSPRRSQARSQTSI